MVLCVGLENILCPDPTAERFSQQFLKYKPNHLSGGALHIEALMKNKKVQRMNLSFAKTIAYGGDGMNKSWETDTSFFERASCTIWINERLWNDGNGRSGMYKQS